MNGVASYDATSNTKWVTWLRWNSEPLREKKHVNTYLFTRAETSRFGRCKPGLASFFDSNQLEFTFESSTL